jgi:uncharacterized repeat protein (TIGR01451 family)
MRVSRSGLAAGTYSVVVKEIDPNGGASYILADSDIFVAAPAVALSGYVVSISPATVKAGGSETFTIAVTNNGTVKAQGLLSIEPILTSNGVQTLLKPTKMSAKIQVGQTLIKTLRLSTKNIVSGAFNLSSVVSIDGVSLQLLSDQAFNIADKK